jgi:hypothetical protein
MSKEQSMVFHDLYMVDAITGDKEFIDHFTTYDDAVYHGYLLLDEKYDNFDVIERVATKSEYFE